MKKKFIVAVGIIVVITLIIIFLNVHFAQQTAPISQPLAMASSVYGNPETVAIQGYSGPQQDPVVSPDGQYLFFDDHDDKGGPFYIYYAQRIDYKTWKFLGRVPGIEYPGVEAWEDAAHNFYFVSPPAFKPKGGITIGGGIFGNGTVTNLAPIRGISPISTPSGTQVLNLDIAVTPDGNTLYFSDFILNDGGSVGGIRGAQLAIANRNADGSFTRASNSDEVLKKINAIGGLVYNAGPSPDGLILAFNAAASYGPYPKIYMAIRTSVTASFGEPRYIAATDVDRGTFSESPSFSRDGTYMYFHRVLSDTSSQLYVLTRQ